MHLRSISIPNSKMLSDQYPFNIPVVKGWGELELTAPVTFFVGENGSGKSSILEAVAASADMVTVGSASIRRDKSMAPARALGDSTKLVWNKPTRKGFFLRAEDYFGYVKAQTQSKAEMQAEIERIDEEYEGRSEYAKGLAKMASAGQIQDMESRYGESLDHYSHGESFLAFFQARFVPGGLYLLDEPETPLSPLRQLGFLSLLKEMIAQDSQFIIATHSPIIMAFPGAVILDFDQTPPTVVDYNSLEHVTVTRDFLNDPEAFLRHL